MIARESEFVDAVKYRGVADQLKAGTYRFAGGEDIGAIIDTMVTGNTGYTLTIPEGYTARKIADTVASACELDADEFYELTLSAGSYEADARSSASWASLTPCPPSPRRRGRRLPAP